MLLLQEEEQARGGAADVVADLSEAIKVAEASSPAGTVSGAGAAVEQAPGFPEEAGSAVQAAGGSPDEVPMAAATAASMGAAPIEMPAEPAVAGGSGGTLEVLAATGSAARTTVYERASSCCLDQQLWRCLVCLQLHVGFSKCGCCAAPWLCSMLEVPAVCRQLRLRLGLDWRQGRPGTIRLMSGVLAGTFSCHVTGASDVWRHLPSCGLLVPQVGFICFADHHLKAGHALMRTAYAELQQPPLQVGLTVTSSRQEMLKRPLHCAGDQLGLSSVYLALVAAPWSARSCCSQECLPSLEPPGDAEPPARDWPSAGCRRAGHCGPTATRTLCPFVTTRWLTAPACLCPHR